MVTDTNTSLLSAADINERNFDYFGAFENDEALTEEQLEFIKEICDLFDADENEADRGILFEMTGF